MDLAKRDIGLPNDPPEIVEFGMVRLWKAFLNMLAGLRWGIRYETALREEVVALLSESR